MGFIRAASMFGEDEPDLKVKAVVKNPAIQSQLDQLIKKNIDTTRASESSISRFLESFKESAPAVRSQIASGIETVGDIYDDTFTSDLERLRYGEAEARRRATDRALSQARARDKAYAASIGLPGRSSYRDLMEARVMSDLEDRLALRGAEQERSDYLTALNARLGNLGTSAAALQTLGTVEGMPTTYAAQMRGIPLNNLIAQTQLDQLNKFYTLYKERSGVEKLADFDDEFWNTVGQIVSMVAAVKGAGSGAGAVRPPATPGSQVTQPPPTAVGTITPVDYYREAGGSTNPYAPPPAPGINPGTTNPYASTSPNPYDPGASNPYRLGFEPPPPPTEIKPIGSLTTY